jgi:hypothetical protein
VPKGRIPTWFKEAVEGLLDERTGLADLKRCADQLHQGLSSLADVVETCDLNALSDRTFPSGRAISPAAAAACIKDFRRTAAFLRGVEAALHDARGRIAGRLEVVYAGTGPFALLLLPFLADHEESNVRFTLIDAHVPSCLNLCRLISQFGLEGISHVVVCADASRYVHRLPLHLAIVETMQRALLNEPQVAITANLASQLHADGVLVPEQVTVHLARVAEGSDALGVLPADERTPVLALSRSIAREAPPALRSGVTVYFEPTSRSQMLALFTSVHTFGGHRIGWNESGITLPVLVHDVELQSAAGIHVQYVVGAKPGFALRPVASVAA